MKRILVFVWLTALLVCVVLATWHRSAWREFARSPAQTDGEVIGYGDHSASNYAFRVANQVYRGSGRSPEIGENMFIGRVVKVFYCVSDPTVNSLTPPPGDPDAYVRARCFDYVGNRMLCVTLAFAMLHLVVRRAHEA